MNTTAHTPLPQLIPAHRCAAIAWIDRGESSLRDVAAQLDLAADELLDILTLPHVAAFIEVADKVLQIRRNILARYDDIDARQSLVAVAKNPEADHVTRLRAAITILQGPPPRRSPASPQASPTAPADSCADRPTIPRSTRAPAPPPTTAQPVQAQSALAQLNALIPGAATGTNLNHVAVGVMP